MICLAFRASTGRHELQKREKGDGVLVVFSMLKLTKMMEKIRKPISADRVYLYFPCEGFLFILQFLLDFW